MENFLCTENKLALFLPGTIAEGSHHHIGRYATSKIWTSLELRLSLRWEKICSGGNTMQIIKSPDLI